MSRNVKVFDMGAPRAIDGFVSRQRKNLPRKRHNMRVELRSSVYEKLLKLSAGNEPNVSVIERCIEQVYALPTECKEVCTYSTGAIAV